MTGIRSVSGVKIAGNVLMLAVMQNTKGNHIAMLHAIVLFLAQRVMGVVEVKFMQMLQSGRHQTWPVKTCY
jgi:hypothetical protein